MPILKCPRCGDRLTLTDCETNALEVRRGRLVCAQDPAHEFAIEDGIIRFTAGFDHEAVKKEIEYENSTYVGDDNRMRDPKTVAQFPDSLPDLWPHTCHFGPDFRDLIDHLDVQPGQWILDIGTGPCWSSRLLAQRGAKVIALDVNEANFYGLKTSDILFEAHGIYFERILESMTHLPFRDGTIDHITFNASFHHTPDAEKSLQECFRVLRPGGKAAMVNEEFTSMRHKWFPDGHVLTDLGSHHDIPYTEFEAAVKRCGFKADFYVADHVSKSLERRLSKPLGQLANKIFETFPLALKQLKSALVILTKPGTLGKPGAASSSRMAGTGRPAKLMEVAHGRGA